MQKVLPLAVVLGIGSLGLALPPYPPPDIVAQVVRVIDGKTIEAKLLQVPDKYAPDLLPKKVVQVRYIGVKVPELDQPDGKTAADLNRLLVENREVYLELESRKEEWWDSHGRLLAYVYLDPHGYLMVNTMLIATPIIGVEEFPYGLRYETSLKLADVHLYIDIVDLSDPVIPGGLAWIVIKTAPGAVCTAEVRYTVGLPAYDLYAPGREKLPEKKAYSDGIVEWSFWVPKFITSGIDVRITATFGNVETTILTYMRLRLE